MSRDRDFAWILDALYGDCIFYLDGILSNNQILSNILFIRFWYGIFPASLFYWLVMLSCIGSTVYCSQELCMREELKPIILSGGNPNPRSPAPVENDTLQSAQGKRRGTKANNFDEIELALLP